MAVTAIWDIKGRVDKVINYVSNPEKTTEKGLDFAASLHAIDDVLEYVGNDMKTEKRMYVTGINCNEFEAATQFKYTKEHWRKTGGIVAFHGYQSFLPGEVDADTAHEIGKKLAQELWGDRFEVVVATHLNRDHYHNHFVLNSVSYKDGKRYYDQKQTYARMREVSDRLCREYRLSVIEHPENRKKNYGEWIAEKNGKPTMKGSMLKSGKEIKVFSIGDKDLEKFCREAKKYGVLYCVLKDKTAADGHTDVFVRAEDASKINRIFERFGIATADIGSARAEIVKEQEKKRKDADIPAPDRNTTEKDKDEAFLDALLSPTPNKEEAQTQNPTEGPVAKSRQSEPISRQREKTARGTSDSSERSRPSVRQEMNEIREEQRKRTESAPKSKDTPQKITEHKEVPKKKKETKER